MADGEPCDRRPPSAPAVSIPTIAREWARLGCIGFGGPPTHIALLRKLCVDERGWIDAQEFEDGIAATNLLPGPASTQLAIFCSWRLGGTVGGIVGGVCFIVPGLIVILALSGLFLASKPPEWIVGAAAGAGAARCRPSPLRRAAKGLVPASWRQGSGSSRAQQDAVARLRIVGGCSRRRDDSDPSSSSSLPAQPVSPRSSSAERSADRSTDGRSGRPLAPVISRRSVRGFHGAVAWVAFKVGALSPVRRQDSSSSR